MSRHKRHQRGRPSGQRDERDAVGEWEEWLDHQYDPGYYTGGRISPLLRGGSGGRAGRGGPFGYVLLGSGSLCLLAGLAGLRHDPGSALAGAAVPMLIGAAQLAAGWRLSRGRRR